MLMMKRRQNSLHVYPRLKDWLGYHVMISWRQILEELVRFSYWITGTKWHFVCSVVVCKIANPNLGAWKQKPINASFSSVLLMFYEWRLQVLYRYHSMLHPTQVKWKKKDFQTTTALPRLASARGAAGIWFYPLRIRPSRHAFSTSL